MAPTSDIGRLHERIDALNDKVDGMRDSMSGINLAMTKIAATCDVCRPIVLGNGHKPIDQRVTILESLSVVRSKGFWVIAAGIVSVVSALSGAAASAVVRLVMLNAL